MFKLFQQMQRLFAGLNRTESNLHTNLRLTLVTDLLSTTVPAEQQNMVISGVGSCKADIAPPDAPELLCRSGVRAPGWTLVSVASPEFRSEVGTMGNMTGGRELLGGLSPVEKWVSPLATLVRSPSAATYISDALHQPGANLVFTARRPLAELTRELRAENVDLSRYVSQQR